MLKNCPFRKKHITWRDITAKQDFNPLPLCTHTNGESSFVWKERDDDRQSVQVAHQPPSHSCYFLLIPYTRPADCGLWVVKKVNFFFFVFFFVFIQCEHTLDSVRAANPVFVEGFFPHKPTRVLSLFKVESWTRVVHARKFFENVIWMIVRVRVCLCVFAVEIMRLRQSSDSASKWNCFFFFASHTVKCLFSNFSGVCFTIDFVGYETFSISLIAISAQPSEMQFICLINQNHESFSSKTIEYSILWIYCLVFYHDDRFRSW